MVNRLRVILGDQLNEAHSWFSDKDEQTLYVIAELHEEATYVTHHVQKICAFFLAMQTFAESLEANGHKVLHLSLDDTHDTPDVGALLTRLASEQNATVIEYQRPDEQRLLNQLRVLSIPGVEILECDTEHFLVPFEELGKHFQQGKAHRMETFYRKMRQRHQVLMKDGQPLGGKWNYDASNRKKLKKADLAVIPTPLTFAHDVTAILGRLTRHNIEHIGSEKKQIWLPVSRNESLQLLDWFCESALPRFGDFQDAMTDQSEHAWSLFHSRLSFSINTKILHPVEVIEAAVNAYHSNDAIDISQVEGFVRQILGWREFIRGIYWANMPGYKSLNELNAERPLPDYFWSGDTQMNCVKQAVTQSLDYAFAHHIQRLMVTGVFGLIAGIHPDEMDAWYLGVYVDAHEWVEMPNTRGMSQFADGGLVASKPYAASGNYINKMGDYCQSCHYNVKEKVTEDACPFNALYWHFMLRHRDRFESNPRIGMVYRSWDKQDSQVQKLTMKKGDDLLETLSEL
ncbi:MAG: cryptochrome/photolyase family protein [Pseudomonadales bacterium]|nr:cryptochrome/photolyase family protein [Pseudomonadales bacterium]